MTDPDWLKFSSTLFSKEFFSVKGFHNDKYGPLNKKRHNKT